MVRRVGSPRSQRSSERRRRLLFRLILPAAVLVLVVVGVCLLVFARASVPGLNAKVYPIHFRDAIARVAEGYGLDPYLVAAVARSESGYDPEVVSHAGAVGLMQLMPQTAAWITKLDAWQGPDEPVLTDPEHSLELGACYLAYLLDRFGGDELAAIAAYNAGQGTVDGWLSQREGGGALGLDDILYGETKAFVQRVERYKEIYVQVHPDIFSGEQESD